MTEDQREGAEIFLDYLLDPACQAMAIDNFLRPVEQDIPLHSPLALADGTDPSVTMEIVPALESPSAEAAGAVKDVFLATKKKATVIILLDTSGSMEGEKIVRAVESSIGFIQRLDPDDEVFIFTFSGNTVAPGQGGRAGGVSEALEQRLRGLFAEGNTPLYDAICDVNSRIKAVQAVDTENDKRRLYGIVLLSDGEDTSSLNSQNQMFNCLPSGEDVSGVKIFTIAYGEDADSDLMLRIANRTNGRTFTGDPDQIERIYNAISAEQ